MSNEATTPRIEDPADLTPPDAARADATPAYQAPTAALDFDHDKTVPMSAPDDAAAREVALPRDIGAVHLVRRIGRGGMGEVHLGRHKFLHRDVAVKFMLAAVRDENDQAFKRFVEGASAAAAASHPGLTAILHADAVQGVPYIVMEYIEGPTLAEALARCGPMTEAGALAALAQVADAVAALHERDMVHRDIKPSNVLLSVEGRLHVTDFGLTLARPPGAYGSTRAGIAGTGAYMAPECFEGEFSARSDVYALGMLAFELLTGHPPFEGSILETRRQHREAPLPVERLREAGVSPPVVELIERATYKNRVFRYKSAAHLRHAAERLLTEELRRAGAAELQRRAVLRPGDGEHADEGAAAGDSTTSYFDRLSSLADRQLRTTATRASALGRGPGGEAPGERTTAAADDDADPPPGTERQIEPAVDVRGRAAEANRPERRNAAARSVLMLRACPQCGCSLADLPRRYRCPSCSFFYDESMFVLEQQGQGRRGGLLAGGRIAATLRLSLLVGGAAVAGLLLLWSTAAALAAAFIVALMLAVLWLVGRLGGRGSTRLIFTSRGVARRRGAGPFDLTPWSEFSQFEFTPVAAGGAWRVALRRERGCGVLHLLTGDPLHDESCVEGVFVMSAREAALVRNEIRRRVRAVAETWA